MRGRDARNMSHLNAYCGRDARTPTRRLGLDDALLHFSEQRGGVDAAREDAAHVQAVRLERDR